MFKLKFKHATVVKNEAVNLLFHRFFINLKHKAEIIQLRMGLGK